MENVGEGIYEAIIELNSKSKTSQRYLVKCKTICLVKLVVDESEAMTYDDVDMNLLCASNVKLANNTS